MKTVISMRIDGQAREDAMADNRLLIECGIALDDALTQLDKLLRKQVGPMPTSITQAAYRRRVLPVPARRGIGRPLAAGAA